MILIGASCGGTAKPISQHRLGEKVAVGSITYSALTADYRQQIAGAKDPVKDRYLVIFLSATNGTSQVATLPHTRLIAANGKEIPELTEIDGFPQWLGLLRTVSASGTEQGYVVFDAPVGTYKLQVSSGGDPEKEQLAQIEIPANLVPASPGGVAGPSLGN